MSETRGNEKIPGNNSSPIRSCCRGKTSLIRNCYRGKTNMSVGDHHDLIDSLFGRHIALTTRLPTLVACDSRYLPHSSPSPLWSVFHWICLIFWRCLMISMIGWFLCWNSTQERGRLEDARVSSPSVSSKSGRTSEGKKTKVKRKENRLLLVWSRL